MAHYNLREAHRIVATTRAARQFLDLYPPATDTGFTQAALDQIQRTSRRIVGTPTGKPAVLGVPRDAATAIGNLKLSALVGAPAEVDVFSMSRDWALTELAPDELSAVIRDAMRQAEEALQRFTGVQAAQRLAIIGKPLAEITEIHRKTAPIPHQTMRTWLVARAVFTHDAREALRDATEHPVAPHAIYLRALPLVVADLVTDSCEPLATAVTPISHQLNPQIRHALVDIRRAAGDTDLGENPLWNLAVNRLKAQRASEFGNYEQWKARISHAP